MASASAKTNANYIALELAAPFVCPRIGALAATCKELRTASLSTITWTPFFRRRWPCLATLEHFAAPTDARALVKGLLRAVPPPYFASPPCPRDSSGRALPLRGEVILAVQLSIRGSGCAFAHGTRRLSELDLHRPRTQFDIRDENDVKDWMFDMPMDHIDEDFVNGPGLAAALSLPEKIAVSPERFLVGTPSADNVLVWGEPDKVIPNLLETFCRQADANLLPEIYVVAGDNIWLLNREDKSDASDSFEYYHDHFQGPLHAWHTGHYTPSSDDDPFALPWFPLVWHKHFPWMTARWTLGSYGGDGFADMMESMSVKYDGYVCLEFCAWWSNSYQRDFDDAAAADAAEHECLCQLLATTRPVRFPRRQQAA